MKKKCDTCGKEKELLSWETTCYQCQLDKERDQIRNRIKEADEDEEVDTFSSKFVICPYCGNLIDARIYGFYDFEEAYTEGEHDLKCDECGKTYRLTTEVTYSWETHKIGKE